MSDTSTRIVKFLKTVTVRDASQTRFEEGQTYELPVASAARWIRRAVAVEVERAARAVAPVGYKGMPTQFEVEDGEPVPAALAVTRAMLDAELEIAAWNKSKPAERKRLIEAASAAIVAERGEGNSEAETED